MTTLDERARAAAADLRDRAGDRPLPDVGSLDPSPRRGRVLAVALAAAAIVVVLAAVAFTVGDRDDDIDVIASPGPAPAGIEPATWSVDELGLSVQVPGDWEPGGSAAGFTHSIVGDPMDAYVLAALVPDHAGRDLDGFATARRAWMEAELDVDAGASSEADVDGRLASVWEYTLRLSGREAVVTEYVIDTGGQDRLIVVVGELLPVGQEELRRWIGSTIEVESVAGSGAPVEHPVAEGPPDGVEPVEWAPPVVGLAMDLPADWEPGAPFETSVPNARSAPGEGPRPFVLASRLGAAAGNPAARAAAREAEGGVQEASAEVVVDGRPATVARWRMPVDEVAAAIQVEYGIELEDGAYAVVTIGYPPGVDPTVADWIRSTFRVTD
jgi:hypothetical protein